MSSQTIRTIIVDDEPLARRYLRSLFAGNADFTIVAECDDGPTAVTAISDLKPEVVFLDVQMPGQNGFDVIRSISTEHAPVVVFVTAHDQYAVAAFETHAIEYLLKPFDRSRFDKAIGHVKDEVRRRRLDSNVASRLPAFLDALKTQAPRVSVSTDSAKTQWLTRLPIKGPDRSIILAVEDIVWVESADSYVYIYAGGKRHLLRESLTWIRLNFDPEKFLQIHRRIVINLAHLKELRATSSGDFTVHMTDGSQLPLSRRRRRHLEQMLGHGI
jgi:two-component system LytT family response regulator